MQDLVEFELKLATVASIIARYSVMENIFHGWTGMTLKPEFEAELVDLCVCVLQYLEAAHHILDHPSSIVSQYAVDWRYKEVEIADKKCRSFTVLIDTIESGEIGKGVQGAEEISSSDDSDEEEDSTSIPL